MVSRQDSRAAALCLSLLDFFRPVRGAHDRVSHDQYNDKCAAHPPDRQRIGMAAEIAGGGEVGDNPDYETDTGQNLVEMQRAMAADHHIAGADHEQAAKRATPSVNQVEHVRL